MVMTATHGHVAAVLSHVTTPAESTQDTRVDTQAGRRWLSSMQIVAAINPDEGYSTYSAAGAQVLAALLLRPLRERPAAMHALPAARTRDASPKRAGRARATAEPTQHPSRPETRLRHAGLGAADSAQLDLARSPLPPLHSAWQRTPGRHIHSDSSENVVPEGKRTGHTGSARAHVEAIPAASAYPVAMRTSAPEQGRISSTWAATANRSQVPARSPDAQAQFGTSVAQRTCSGRTRARGGWSWQRPEPWRGERTSTSVS